MAWTSDKIKQLTKLWNKGKSTVEIARELGISKNAVVGKVHRLGLDARPSPIRVPKTIVPTPSKNTPKSHQKEKTSLLDLKINSCRWPYGEPGTDNFHFCGKDAQTGKPYCPEHCKIAYTSLKELAMESARNKKENKPITVLREEPDNTSSNKKNADIKSSNPASGKEASKLETSAAIKAEKKAADKPVKASAKAEPAQKTSASKAPAKAPAKPEKKAEKKATDKPVKANAKTEPAKKAVTAKTPDKAKAEKKAADKPVKASTKTEPAKKAAPAKASTKTKAEKKEKMQSKEPSVSQNLLSKGVKSIKEKLLKGSNKRK